MREHHLSDSDHTAPPNIRLDGKILLDFIKLEILPVSKPEHRAVQQFGFFIRLEVHAKQTHIIAFFVIQGKVEQVSAIKIFLLPTSKWFGYIQVAADPHQLSSANCYDSYDCYS